MPSDVKIVRYENPKDRSLLQDVLTEEEMQEGIKKIGSYRYKPGPDSSGPRYDYLIFDKSNRKFLN